MLREWQGRSVVAAVMLCTLMACAGPVASLKSKPETDLYWPKRPLQPRIQWIRTVEDSAGAGISKPFWKKALEFIAGADQRHMLRPYGVLLDQSDRLFIADPGAGVVHLMDLKEQRYSVLDGGGGGRLRTPIGLTEDLQNRLYITDSTSGDVIRYDLATGVAELFPVPQLYRPTGIAFNAVNKLIYIVDTTANEVVAVDQSGTEKERFGSSFNHPTDICVDRKGQVYVTDALNYRIKIFTPEGQLLNEIGTAGDELGRLDKPKGVAVDSEGHIYISDALLDAVQVFDASGQFLLSFGSTGTSNGEFWMPSGLYIDQQDYLLVADSYNRRIQVFRYLSNAQPDAVGTGAVSSRPR